MGLPLRARSAARAECRPGQSAKAQRGLNGQVSLARRAAGPRNTVSARPGLRSYGRGDREGGRCRGVPDGCASVSRPGGRDRPARADRPARRAAACHVGGAAADGLLPRPGMIAPQFAGVDLGLTEKLAVRAVATAAGTDPAEVAALVARTGDLGQAAEQLLEPVAADRPATLEVAAVVR